MALPPELVRVRDGRFHVGGSPFPVVGANCYYLAYASPRMRGDVLAVANQLGLNTIRSPAFLDCKAASSGTVPEDAWRGVYFQCWDPDKSRPRLNEGADGLQRLDHLIADAEAAGIRLILPLVNHWPDFGGTDRYVEWFQAGSPDQFYRSPRVRGAYQAYVKQVLMRRNTVTGRLYKEEPAILAWELANEPQSITSDGCEVLLGWVREMSRWVKQQDRNHLLSVGDEGQFAGGAGDLYDGRYGVDCEAFLQVADIDFGTFHMYPEAWKQPDPIKFGIQWIEQHLAAGRKACKPMLLEEFGMTVGVDGQSSRLTRNFVYRYWLQTVLSESGAGDLAWMLASVDDLTGNLYPDYDHFTFYSAAEVMSIRDHVLEMTQQAPADPEPPLNRVGPEQGAVHLWVTDRNGTFLDENQTRVIVRRDGQQLGDPIMLDFSGGPVQINLPAFPAGNWILEIQPRTYQSSNCGPFPLRPRERRLLHVTVDRNRS
jgi:mannan endo-1,4-beta-mannosidase